VLIDHLCWLVKDATAARSRLRAEHGLGTEQGSFFADHGTQHHNVPLSPPQYLELAEITGEPDSWTTHCRDSGVPVLGWAVLVADLEQHAERLGQAIRDRTLAQTDGTLRGWRCVVGPRHLPFFIDYPNNGDRSGRWEAMRERVGHDRQPGMITRLQLEQDADELAEWLGPHDLPLDLRPGSRGAVALDIEAIGTLDLTVERA
jgi:hypothetical protein